MGGANQQDRMIGDKLKSLRKALLYSYQAETIELADGRQFKCLINPNKLNMDLDDKMLSIPFEDICLNNESSDKEKIGIKAGDVVSWIHKNDTVTHWMIYLQYLQEKSYFRGFMRQCEEEIQINGSSYWVYLKGPDEKGIDWTKSNHNIFNDLNYTLELYISKTKETNEFFQRFKIINLQGNSWEVQAVDRMTTEGIICVYLKEHYTNVYEQAPSQSEEEKDQTSGVPQIVGPIEVYPFDIVTYSVINTSGGIWSLSNGRAKILESDEKNVKIEITTGKSGNVSLIYNDIIFNIKILSL